MPSLPGTGPRSASHHAVGSIAAPISVRPPATQLARRKFVRPPKLAIRAAMGALIATAILAVGAVSASAAPNPGFGTPGTQIVPSGPSPNDGANNFPFSYPFNLEAAADGPQTANVPTLAWVGEDVRLVACDNDIVAKDDQVASMSLARRMTTMTMMMMMMKMVRLVVKA